MYKQPLTKNQKTSTIENVSININQVSTESDTFKNKLESIMNQIILILNGKTPTLSYIELYCLREEITFLNPNDILKGEIERQTTQIISTTLTEICKLVNTSDFLIQFNKLFGNIFNRFKLIDKLFHIIEQQRSCVDLCKYLNNYCSSYIYS